MKESLPKSDLCVKENTNCENNIWVNFLRTGKMVKMWLFFSFALTKRFDFFQLFSTVLIRFCLLHFKNDFVLDLAHLEPEVELFEVWR